MLGFAVSDFMAVELPVVFPPSAGNAMQTILANLTQDSLFEPLHEGFYLVVTVNYQLNLGPIDSLAIRGVVLITIQDIDSELFYNSGSFAIRFCNSCYVCF